ncbi:MAG TPA: hypothetical protein DIW47_14095 [Bacteroidetes bacterium]|nr:hypothetical protein [Bacteroidota bacterium]
MNHKNTFVACILALTFFSSLQAQSIKVSESHTFTKSYFSQIIGMDSNQRIYSIFHGAELELGISDPGMRTLIKRIPVDLNYKDQKERVQYVTSYFHKGTIRLIGMILTENSLRFMKQILDQNGALLQDWTEITGFTASAKTMEVSWNTALSENYRFGAIWISYTRPHDKKCYFKLIQLNEDLEVIWENFYEHPFDRYSTRQENLKIDRYGNIYIVLSQYTEHYDLRSALMATTRAIYLKSLLVFNSLDGRMHVRQLEKENHLLDHLNLFFDEQNVYLSGFSSRIEDTWDRFTGFALASFPIKDTGTVHFKFIPFGEEIKGSQVYLKEDSGTKTSFYTRHRIVLQGMGTIYVSEYEYGSTSGTGSRTIVLLCVDNLGNVIWQKTIERNMLVPGNYGGYALLFDGKHFGIVFADHVKNFVDGNRVANENIKLIHNLKFGCATIAIIDISGNISYRQLWKYKESGKTSLISQHYRVNDLKQLAFETELKGKDKCFIFLQFEEK